MTSNYHYFLLVVDDSLDFNPGPDFPRFHRLLLSEYHLDIPKNSGAFLSQQVVIATIERLSQGQPVAIIPFKPSAKIEHLCHDHKWLYVANQTKTNRSLEDKVLFATLSDQLNLPTIPHTIGQFSPELISSCQKKFAVKQLVIQTHFGWAGQSTYLVTGTDDAAEKIPIGTYVKIMPKLSGYTLLNNCCLYRDQLLQSPPALQLTGLKPYTTNPFTTVGRQWPSFAPAFVLQEIKKITEHLSAYLADTYHYRGFFGLDFFVTDQNLIYLLECNPRLTASYPFYTLLEQKAGLTPLFYYHLDEFGHDLDLPKATDRFDEVKIIGTEITPKDDQGNTIKNIHFPTPITRSPFNITLPDA